MTGTDSDFHTASLPRFRKQQRDLLRQLLHAEFHFRAAGAEAEYADAAAKMGVSKCDASA